MIHTIIAVIDEAVVFLLKSVFFMSASAGTAKLLMQARYCEALGVNSCKVSRSTFVLCGRAQVFMRGYLGRGPFHQRMYIVIDHQTEGLGFSE